MHSAQATALAAHLHGDFSEVQHLQVLQSIDDVWPAGQESVNAHFATVQDITATHTSCRPVAMLYKYMKHQNAFIYLFNTSK
jgi:hypothetical protein